MASEALWHLLGGMDSEWRPRFLKYKPKYARVEPTPHWFLQRPWDGRVLDPTADQFHYLPRYAEAVHVPFLTREPSRRARIVIDRVVEALGIEPSSG